MNREIRQFHKLQLYRRTNDGPCNTVAHSIIILVQFLEFFVVVCIFDEFIELWVYFDGEKNYRHY